jgi:hypothetical protein
MAVDSPVRAAPPETGCVASSEMMPASRQMAVRLLTTTVWRVQGMNARQDLEFLMGPFRK